MLLHASGDSLAELCVTKLAAFLQDLDQNCENPLVQSYSNLMVFLSSEVYRAFSACENSSHTSESSGKISRYDNLKYQRPGP